jgi:predicted solute-binding protein
MRIIYAPKMVTELKKLWQKQAPLPQPLGFFAQVKV